VTRSHRPERRALEAARLVALDLGLDSPDARVLSAGSNVLVHLHPAPVVARVMTGTAVLHDDPEEWLTREVAVGRFLGERGLAVPPTDLLPPGPHVRDGLWLTLWRFVGHERSDGMAAAALGARLGELHRALADYTGELAPLSSVRDWLAMLIDKLGDAGPLRSELDALSPGVFEPTGQPLHGDMSVSNLLRTEDGLLWNDLEDVCTGPVEWDLAGLVTSVRARGANDEYVEALIDAYGGPGLDDLHEFLAAHELYVTVWQRWRASS
jgi:hypothetical protein